jgi:hypothetical protein
MEDGRINERGQLGCGVSRVIVHGRHAAGVVAPPAAVIDGARIEPGATPTNFEDTDTLRLSWLTWIAQERWRGGRFGRREQNQIWHHSLVRAIGVKRLLASADRGAQGSRMSINRIYDAQGA